MNKASSTQLSIIKKLTIIAGTGEFDSAMLSSLTSIGANKLIVQLMKEANLHYGLQKDAH